MSHITIFSASIGHGHNEASKALKAQLEEEGRSVDIVDTFHAIHPILHKSFVTVYLNMIKRAPTLWGSLYKYGAEHSWYLLVDKLASLFCGRLNAIITTQNTSIMISTNPFVTSFLSIIKKKRCLDIPLYTIITDFDLHPGYVRPEVDAYFTGSPYHAEFAAEHNIPLEQIHFTGIPIKAIPEPLTPRTQMREELGLEPYTKTILITGGGLGLGKYNEIIRSLEEIKEPLQVLCMTGINQKVAKQLQKVQSTHSIKVIEFTEIFLDYLRASDVVLSKAGGLTMSEALACETPMLIYNPVPGHEENNATLLSGLGAAVKADQLSEVTLLLEHILFNDTHYNTLVQNAKRSKKPDAAKQIARKIEHLQDTKGINSDRLQPS
ncbi:hypothetical protein BTR22_01080 [Alkalihalophilus pseudofirmus]|uniref:MGDG synthase family glycosyltransferase n=1 Tax=Alkalihalophilus pseudofirmus TaxID=79885 RepID=UPI00095230C4|nr:hypothetical protein BTR22_01080 [Alkalihalophilus pseudofirmus]